MKHSSAIDFVVTWVDDRDPAWQKKREEHLGLSASEGNSDVRYRDWDTLKYWFRGVEKCAPWVRNIYFVTDGQKPDWLNLDHPKLKWVRHGDFMPSEYLPTFSSDPIEWNMHRIDGLSENFVYFNDDVFLIKETSPEDFFVRGEPCDLPSIGVQYANGLFSRMLFNNNDLLNRHFSFKDSVKAFPGKWIRKQPLSGLLKLLLYGRERLYPGSNSHHIQTSYKKSTFQTLWEQEYDVIHQTCINKLRTGTDVTIYSVRDWQILTGGFQPHKPIGKMFHTASLDHSDEAIQYLKKQKGKVVCLNDSETEKNFDLHKQMIIDAFEKLFPEKSAFEL